ncbi:hypothetical protein ACJJTC_000511 [Scirpophaga incertulas]
MTDITTDVDSEDTEVKKPMKEIQVVQDKSVFVHNTGDVYDGSFELKKKDKIARMHGPGTYITAVGDIYTGIWEADKLGANEVVSINFIDGSRFEGSFRDWSYSGPGRYYYADGSVLKGEFAENTLVGQLELSDPNGHVWLGKAQQGFAWFEARNHYFDMLPTTCDREKVKRHHKGPQEENLSP